MIDFSSKTVLITGGSRGIGAACVKLFANANADVAFTYSSNQTAAKKLASEISKTKKIKHYMVDLNSATEIEECTQKIISDFGMIDILINNAGIWKYGKADELTLEEWEETIRINLTGTFLFTKAVIPTMKKNRFGRIINISSTAGQRGEPFYSHYASSKGGVIALTKSLAAELGEYNINVNCVAPGWVITDMSAGVFSDSEYKEKVRNDIPVKRIATAEDIAGPVLFLASDLARHINGEILNVNGGSVLCG
ncbi:MAG TPA: 3-oxoacyl-ACP reductase FabG [Ignavibacteriaceae bacterium]|nr:3-oxoacyl-ACP reductase FabG [Ignavibacteriaceae bacterium]